jgi:hypothetical protein
MDWFVNNEPVMLNNRRYVRFGLARTIAAAELESVGMFRNVPVFAQLGTARPAEVVYLPVRPGCELQPFNYEPAVRGVRGDEQ